MDTKKFTKLVQDFNRFLIREKVLSWYYHNYYTQPKRKKRPEGNKGILGFFEQAPPGHWITLAFKYDLENVKVWYDVNEKWLIELKILLIKYEK